MPTWLTIAGILVVGLLLWGAFVDWRDRRNGRYPGRFLTDDDVVYPANRPQYQRFGGAAMSRVPAPARLQLPAPAPRQVPYLKLVVDNGPLPAVRVHRTRNPRIYAVK